MSRADFLPVAAAVAGEFVNCDWGTTHFRLRAVRAAGREIVASVQSDQGAAHLASSSDTRGRAEGFRRVLEGGLRQLQDRAGPVIGPVVISGMASSSIGWQELPYAKLPLYLDGRDLLWQELEPLVTPSGPRRVVLVSGACTDSDVMRGEETQALGAFQLPATRHLAAHSLLIMPGTHSKHLEIESGQIRNFRTFMTGELFELLGRHSILRHSVGALDIAPAEMSGEAEAAFREGLDQSRATGLSAALFRVRTRELLDKLPGLANRAFLSGALVGAELAYLERQEFAGRALVLCAAKPLASLYATALDALGLGQQLTAIGNDDVDRLSALGQAALLENLRER
jgi:2-dehydro-3-deoxygalactonokinase